MFPSQGFYSAQPLYFDHLHLDCINVYKIDPISEKSKDGEVEVEK